MKKELNIDHYVNTYSVLTHTLSPWGGFKRLTRFCNVLSDRYGVRLQVIQPLLKFRYLFSQTKYISIRHLNYENQLEECHLWLTLK